MHTFIDVSSESLKAFVNHWNSSFPVDAWWRNKHNVAFNSLVHQQSCFIDQLIEFYEEQFDQDIAKTANKKEEKYQPGKRNWLKAKVYSEKEIENMFNNMNLDEL